MHVKKDRVTNDIILRILQNTYLFQSDKVDALLTELFYRYLNILDYLNFQIDKKNINNRMFEDIETARAILYFIGYYYTENFCLGAIERRIAAYDIEPLRFYTIVDSKGEFNTIYLEKSEANTFYKIVDFYKLLKKWKNLEIPGCHLYLAEDYYNATRKRLYNFRYIIDKIT